MFSLSFPFIPHHISDLLTVYFILLLFNHEVEFWLLILGIPVRESRWQGDRCGKLSPGPEQGHARFIRKPSEHGIDICLIYPGSPRVGPVIVTEQHLFPRK